MNNQIPSEVIAMIDQYIEAKSIEEERKNLEEQRVAEEIALKGKAIVDQWVENAFQSIPAWLHHYYAFTANVDYFRVVKGWEHEDDLVLTFKIPGLAQIQFKDKNWRSETCGWNRGYEDSEPYIHFGNSSWRSSLESTLVIAKTEMEEHENNLIEYEAEKARALKRSTAEAEWEEKISQKIDEEKEQKRAAELAEEEALLQALKNDPVAIHMLKAFVLLRDERGAFEQRLEEMGEEVYSIENHYSRKAADLRRQADEAERRASEKESSLRSLQNDLDDAEEKLKKAQRGC